jgi:3-methyladenine DNA glycosylase Tag
MRPPFSDIYADAVDRKGEPELDSRLPEVKSRDELAELPDDRYLAAMARSAFSAGFKHYIVDNMWEGFETVFHGFDPARVARFDNDRILELGDDERIVRNKTKIWATVENARMVCDLAEEHGSFGEFVVGWDLDETVQLWELLGERGTHLGGNTGARSLRHAGRDTFLLTRDITWALREKLDIMSYSRHAETGRRQAQEAFLAWHDETGRPLSHISMVLACAWDTPEEQ